ncbi:MAG TPA: hypothetical protein VM368_02925 [Flavisolibacter sp.]|nr:hypothetical protein [Flavisolibacter sp.]
MSERIHTLAQHLLNKSSVEACSLDEIETLVNRYPYFAPAQFLLLQKLKQEDASKYQSHLQKAVLYYHNPLEFEHFISSEKFYKEIDEAPEDFGEQESDVDLSDAGEPEVNVGSEETKEPEEIIEPEHLESPTTEVYPDAADDAPPETEEQKIDIEGPGEELNVPAQDVEETATPPVDSEIGKDEIVPAIEDQDFQQEDEQAEDAEKLKGILSRVTAESEKADTGLAFEPYHTVDYFASQGIKPSLETPNDTLGKQLKSFTEWLKVMKKLPATQIPKHIDRAAEHKVENMANKSVNEADIVTEAMADVWIKQGNKEKAIEIYNKLGLLNPSKTAFFAAKIENLKNS